MAEGFYIVHQIGENGIKVECELPNEAAALYLNALLEIKQLKDITKDIMVYGKTKKHRFKVVITDKPSFVVECVETEDNR